MAIVATPWCEPQRPTAHGAVQLFCLPFAGGSAYLFRDWQERLPAAHVYPVELPGRGRRLREPPQRDLLAIARDAAAALAPMCTRPFVIFGHSMGGLVGFEIARLLEQRYACVPHHLIVAAARAPHVAVHETITYDLPEREFLRHVRDIGETPPELLDDEELRALFVPVLRADFQATETYRYQQGPPLTCPITALGGLADPAVSREQVRAWQMHTTGEFACRMVPGAHFFVTHRAEECLAIVAEVLWRQPRPTSAPGDCAHA